MRHKYDTRGIVLTRTPHGEANALLTLLTPDLGVVRARVQGIRKPGARLAPALATFVESEVVLVRGKEGWRVAGALLDEAWSARLSTYEARARAARVSGLIARLMVEEEQGSEVYTILKEYFEALTDARYTNYFEEAELLAVLRTLGALGFDTGAELSLAQRFSQEAFEHVAKRREAYVLRVNEGIAASGL